MMRPYFFNIPLLALCLFMPAACMAQDAAPSAQPFNMKVVYDFTLGDIKLGNMGLEIEQTPERYRITGDVATTGILKLFVSHSSHTTAVGSGHHGLYSNVDYDSHYQTRKKRKSVAMRFEKSRVVSETVTPPDNRATRPAVENALKQDSADPMSLILRIRQGLIDALRPSPSPLEGEGGVGGKPQALQQAANPHPNPPPERGREYTIKGYDGRRLTQVDFTVIGKQTIVFNGAKTPVIEVDARRTLLAGFTATELADKDPHEPVLHIYFSDDDKLWPLRLEAKMWMGTLAANLSQTCGAGESCLLGIKE